MKMAPRIPVLVIVNAALALVALASIVASNIFENKLTVRAVLTPSGKYVVPHTTHGGVVFVTAIEHYISLSFWILFGCLILGQLLINFLKRKSAVT